MQIAVVHRQYIIKLGKIIAVYLACALANQAFSRAAGAPLITGNSIRLLKDAKENYPEWLDAKAKSEKDGSLVERVESVYMNPTDYSPVK